MSAPRILRIQNLNTGVIYTETGEGWEALKNCVVDRDSTGRVIARMSDRFTIVDERVLLDTPGTTFEPDEIREAVKRMSAGIKVEQGAAQARVLQSTQ